MNGERPTLESIIESLHAEGLLRDPGRAAALLDRLRAQQPWYVRAMVAAGAWLASMLIVGFVGGIGLATGAGTLVGLLLVVGALVLRRLSGNVFLVQAALAASLAGQALFAWGLTELTGGQEIETTCAIVLVTSTVLFHLFPDRIHRTLMVLFATASLVGLLYALEGNALIPVLGPALAAALVAVERRRASLTATGRGQLVAPLVNGLMLSAFGCLALSTIYVLPELGVDFSFYPRPWISTVLLGALFLYVGMRAWRPLLASGGAAAATVVTLMLAVIAAAVAAPGLLLALIVTVLGTASGNRSFVGAGVAFLALFLAAWFYGIEVTLLAKSVTLVATGAVVLAARWWVLAVLTPAHGEGGAHA